MLLLGPDRPCHFVIVKKKGVCPHFAHVARLASQPTNRTPVCTWPSGVSSSVSLVACCPPDRGTMASAWLSVMVKRGVACLKPRTIVCCEWTDSFSTVLDKLESYSEETVDKVMISTNKKFVDPCHVVPLTAPVSVCDQFRYNFVCFYLNINNEFFFRLTDPGLH